MRQATVGQRIKDLREQLGRRRGRRLTQDWLAQEAGVAKSTVAKWETDVQVPEGDNLLRVAAVLETTPEFILRGEKGDTREQALRAVMRRLVEAASLEVAARVTGVAEPVLRGFAFGGENPGAETVRVLDEWACSSGVFPWPEGGTGPRPRPAERPVQVQATPEPVDDNLERQLAQIDAADASEVVRAIRVAEVAAAYRARAQVEEAMAARLRGEADVKAQEAARLRAEALRVAEMAAEGRSRVLTTRSPIEVTELSEQERRMIALVQQEIAEERRQEEEAREQEEEARRRDRRAAS